jgi:hypothetical protein
MGRARLRGAVGCWEQWMAEKVKGAGKGENIRGSGAELQ